MFDKILEDMSGCVWICFGEEQLLSAKSPNRLEKYDTRFGRLAPLCTLFLPPLLRGFPRVLLEFSGLVKSVYDYSCQSVLVSFSKGSLMSTILDSEALENPFS